MYCPQCGTESGSGFRYCRTCGANLMVINKALTLSEAIARSDRGPLPKLKEMVKNLNVEHVTDEVSRALERMNKEILRTSPSGNLEAPYWPGRLNQKSFEERRENHVVKGTALLFSGIGLMVFLYYFAAALVLKIPPDVLNDIPFELEPAVRVLWMVGLIPALSGAGRLVAGLLMRPARSDSTRLVDDENLPQPADPAYTLLATKSASVTENTTSFLEPRD